MIYQTDDAFPSDIRHFGCYFLSLLWQLNRLFGVPAMTHEDALAVYNAETVDTDLGAECYLEKPLQVCDHVARGKVRAVSSEDASYTCSSREFEIQVWFNSATSFHHYVAAVDGKVAYDPIEGGSRTVREGYVESKRVYWLA